MLPVIKKWYAENRNAILLFTKCFAVVVLSIVALVYTVNPYVQKIYLFTTYCFLQEFVFEHFLQS